MSKQLTYINLFIHLILQFLVSPVLSLWWTYTLHPSLFVTATKTPEIESTGTSTTTVVGCLHLVQTTPYLLRNLSPLTLEPKPVWPKSNGHFGGSQRRVIRRPLHLYFDSSFLNPYTSGGLRLTVLFGTLKGPSPCFILLSTLTWAPLFRGKFPDRLLFLSSSATPSQSLHPPCQSLLLWSLLDHWLLGSLI